ncbi:hypothetical protein [Microbacterium rhizomatis]|uniref:Uncharacterized protein n=1 Tax=Microbacterium rhizomatis TaxID=1631477 RepID=A0A5J5J8E4_9MICO|nr:hypothetical protein [Microbacterium rhizomatis]KAA9111058.1 hypothetical protein F6B43_05440 [Microbacterium rhizomatis]
MPESTLALIAIATCAALIGTAAPADAEAMPTDSVATETTVTKSFRLGGFWVEAPWTVDVTPISCPPDMYLNTTRYNTETAWRIPPGVELTQSGQQLDAFLVSTTPGSVGNVDPVPFFQSSMTNLSSAENDVEIILHCTSAP